MLLFAHLGITLGVLEFAQEINQPSLGVPTKKGTNETPSDTQSVDRTKRNARSIWKLIPIVFLGQRGSGWGLILLGSILPDLVDKMPLLLAQVASAVGSRSVGHTLVFLLIVGLVAQQTWVRFH
jgi:hypothetical protein